MRHSPLRGALACLLLMPVAAGCVIPSSGPPRAEVLAADARALVYGRTASEVLENPQLRDKVRALFGADWGPPSPGAGKLAQAAPLYFGRGGPLRMVHIGDADYIAITGCVTRACATHRGLVLIRADGDELWARLDEGGFSRYYGHGPAMVGAQVSPAFIDSAWRALESVEPSAEKPRVESTS